MDETYVITDDLFFTCECVRRFAEILAVLLQCSVEVIDLEIMRAELTALAARYQSPTTVLLSTYPMVSCDNALQLSINRLFNVDGEFVGYGPRPGSPSLTTQFDTIADAVAGRSVIIVEEGVFSGNTLRYILDELAKRGVRVQTTILGICSGSVEHSLREVLNGELIVHRPFEALLDWVALSDLIPFTGGGRLVGTIENGACLPVAINGRHFSIPYILPFGNLSGWASIPVEHHLVVSGMCWRLAIHHLASSG
ncbi:MAG: hypothetical protein RLY57_5 [Candidatus Parcubacteria bacterium]|jgi:hypothetical protein